MCVMLPMNKYQKILAYFPSNANQGWIKTVCLSCTWDRAAKHCLVLMRTKSSIEYLYTSTGKSGLILSRAVPLFRKYKGTCEHRHDTERTCCKLGVKIYWCLKLHKGRTESLELYISFLEDGSHKHEPQMARTLPGPKSTLHHVGLSLCLIWPITNHGFHPQLALPPFQTSSNQVVDERHLLIHQM